MVVVGLGFVEARSIVASERGQVLLPFKKGGRIWAIVEAEVALEIVEGDFFGAEIAWIVGGHSEYGCVTRSIVAKSIDSSLTYEYEGCY